MTPGPPSKPPPQRKRSRTSRSSLPEPPAGRPAGLGSRPDRRVCWAAILFLALILVTTTLQSDLKPSQSESRGLGLRGPDERAEPASESDSERFRVGLSRSITTRRADAAQAVTANLSAPTRMPRGMTSLAGPGGAQSRARPYTPATSQPARRLSRKAGTAGPRLGRMGAGMRAAQMTPLIFGAMTPRLAPWQRRIQGAGYVAGGPRFSSRQRPLI